MSEYTQCPACRSLNTRVTKGDFRAKGFQALGNRICDQCGTAWRPRCPRWAAIACIITGCVMLGGFSVTAWPDLHSHGLGTLLNMQGRRGSAKGLVGLVTLVVAAFWACLYGIAVLCGHAGKLTVLGKVLPTQGGSAEPERDLANDVPCTRCQRPVSPGSAYCPHCGLQQPS